MTLWRSTWCHITTLIYVKNKANSRTLCWLIKVCRRAWFYITTSIYVETRRNSITFHWPNVVEIHAHGFTTQCRPTVISTNYLSTPLHNKKKEVLHKMFYSLLLHLGAMKSGKNLQSCTYLNKTDTKASFICETMPLGSLAVVLMQLRKILHWAFSSLRSMMVDRKASW